MPWRDVTLLNRSGETVVISESLSTVVSDLFENPGLSVTQNTLQVTNIRKCWCNLRQTGEKDSKIYNWCYIMQVVLYHRDRINYRFVEVFFMFFLTSSPILGSVFIYHSRGLIIIIRVQTKYKRKKSELNLSLRHQHTFSHFLSLPLSVSVF